MSRYIDADLIQYEPMLRPKGNGNYEDCEIAYRDEIDNIPTADVRENVQLDVCPLYGGACGYPSGECYDCPRHGNFRENVRGEWIKEYLVEDLGIMLYVCDKCAEPTVKKTNFCPNCGADMRGGNDV